MSLCEACCGADRSCGGEVVHGSRPHHPARRPNRLSGSRRHGYHQRPSPDGQGGLVPGRLDKRSPSHVRPRTPLYSMRNPQVGVIRCRPLGADSRIFSPTAAAKKPERVRPTLSAARSARANRASSIDNEIFSDFPGISTGMRARPTSSTSGVLLDLTEIVGRWNRMTVLDQVTHIVVSELDSQFQRFELGGSSRGHPRKIGHGDKEFAFAVGLDDRN